MAWWNDDREYGVMGVSRNNAATEYADYRSERDRWSEWEDRGYYTETNFDAGRNIRMDSDVYEQNGLERYERCYA